jgi:hypothetical protein
MPMADDIKYDHKTKLSNSKVKRERKKILKNLGLRTYLLGLPKLIS